MRRAQKELGSQLPLEAVEAGRERRLSDEESLGSAADAAATRDFEEALHLDQLNAAGFAVTWFVYGHGRSHKSYL